MAVSFKGGKNAFLKLSRVGSTMVLSSGVDASDFQRQVETYEVTTWGDGDKNYIVGLRSATLKFSGPFASTYESFFASVLGSTTTVKAFLGPMSTVAGNPQYVMSSTVTNGLGVIPTNFQISAPVGGRVNWSVDLLINGAIKSTKF